MTGQMIDVDGTTAVADGGNSSISSEHDMTDVRTRRLTRSQMGSSKPKKTLGYALPDGDAEDDDDDDDYDDLYTASSRRPSRAKRALMNGKVDGTRTMGAVPTCIQVKQLPVLYERLMKLIGEEENEGTSAERYNKYAIETLLLNCAMDVKNFASEEDLFAFVSNAVVHNRQFIVTAGRNAQPDMSISQNDNHSDPTTNNARDSLVKLSLQQAGPLPKPSCDEYHAKKVVRAYQNLMDSVDMKELRSYRDDAAPDLTEMEWKVFEEALLRYPDSNTSNKKICKHMNNKRIHPNHISMYKRQYKKRLERQRQTQVSGSSSNSTTINSSQSQKKTSSR